jgi:tetratricopeptide (TPR) repeat protein
MDHPNIAKVLDAGEVGQVFNLPHEDRQVTNLPHSGRPYFVMDLVRGVPITRYCDEHHLTPRQRLELFIPVCQAIQHAHQKGIIHRDLKPSNVLVALYDGKPVPKVIDFGVAKAAGQPLTEQTLVTGFGAIVGTLEYMSPEQAEINQLDIDTRSDIYSMGVLLYELLTGSTPFSRKELEKAGMLEMLRVIREEEPSKPSTKLSTAEGLPTLAANRGTEPAKLTKLVRGELDWIVMKALEKDRNRRYETANGFAKDIEHYLNDEPVQACPPSAGYRLRKFARRNKVPLGVTGLALFFLVLLGSGVGWAVRDRAARQAAVEGEAQLALEEAQRLLGQGKYPDSLSAAKRAEGLLAAGGGKELRARVRELRNDLEMVLRLEEIRIQKTITWPDDSFIDNAGRDAAYAKAFRNYGIDVDVLESEEAAARIRARSIRLELVTALDDWGINRYYAARERKENRDGLALLAVARAADSDPWRNRLRDVLNAPKQERLAVLSALARSAKVDSLPATTLRILGASLYHGGGVEEGVALLRRAHLRHPGDFWINLELASCYANMKPPRWDQVLSFDRVLLALRPEIPRLHAAHGHTLMENGLLEEAIAAYREAIRLNPDFAVAHHELGLTQTVSDRGVLVLIVESAL